MLPFEDASFDLVTCRIAPHHFDSIPEFLAETARVLKPTGTLAVVDNVVPTGSVGDYVNAFERFRDPSHLRSWTMQEWQAALAQAGYTIGHSELLFKRLVFTPWAARHDATMRAFLRSMLIEMTPAVAGYFDVRDADDEKAMSFRRRPALRREKIYLQLSGKRPAKAPILMAVPACTPVHGVHIQPARA
jgi:ubiquinone/menaquinone biosynthesis C-methylase UbiE